MTVPSKYVDNSDVSASLFPNLNSEQLAAVTTDAKHVLAVRIHIRTRGLLHRCNREGLPT